MRKGENAQCKIDADFKSRKLGQVDEPETSLRSPASTPTILAHRLLGKAMHILNDYAVLNPADIKISLGESDLHNQVERVRITLQSMSLEDVSKLWTIFQTQYRISAAYEVSVLLIESSRKESHCC